MSRCLSCGHTNMDCTCSSDKKELFEKNSIFNYPNASGYGRCNNCGHTKLDCNCSNEDKEKKHWKRL